MQLALAVADRIEPAPQLPSGSGADHEASAHAMAQALQAVIATADSDVGLNSMSGSNLNPVSPAGGAGHQRPLQEAGLKLLLLDALVLVGQVRFGRCMLTSLVPEGQQRQYSL